MQKDEALDIYFYITGWILIALLAVFALVIKIFGIGILNSVPPCAIRTMTGYYCPGCGGTRAVFTLARGQIIRSFKFNPIVLYSAVVCGWFMISQTIERISGHRIKIAMRFRTIYIWLALIIVVVNFIVKNALIAFAGIYMLG